LSRDAFEDIVAKVVDDLPEEFRQELDNVEIVIEDWPDSGTLQAAGARHPAALLGFYHGIPKTKRTRGYNLVLPDKISIYRRPILMRCRTAEQVHAMVARVLRHEIGHHFGISDERMRELGAY
jgi:predicted Zn-dependent protease with MMP-like domain